MQEAPEIGKQYELDAAVGKQQVVQEYIETASAFPAMLEIGHDKLTGDTIIIDTAASHMVPAKSELCKHVVNEIYCCSADKFPVTYCCLFSV